MHDTNLIILAASFLMACLAMAVLFLVNQERTLSKSLLMLLLGLFAIIDLHGILYFMGWYLDHPALHKMLLPLTLLIAPVGYLYTRAILTGRLRLLPKDAWLLVPALLYALNYLPYYMLTGFEKEQYLQSFYNSHSVRMSDGEGWAPAYVPSIFRALWSLGILIPAWAAIRRYEQSAAPKTVIMNASVLSWLKTLNLMLASLVLAALVSVALAPLNIPYNMPNIAMAIVVIGIGIQLFLRPAILYGIHEPAVAQKEDDAKGLVILPDTGIKGDEAGPDLHEPERLLNEDMLRYKRKVETLMSEHSAYLDPSYTMERLVVDARIPRHILSAFINREYGMGFREWLNRYRVDHFLANVGNPEWERYTLEAMAGKCGFTNRVTFFRNVKQITGITPVDHLKRKSLPDNPSDELLQGLDAL
jgi:AraC-like DNA-binding protein